MSFRNITSAPAVIDMLQGSSHVTDQHPISQEAKDPNNNIPLYTYDRIYVEMASLLKSSQVFGTKNSPSPHNTLDGFAHPLELCNYHDHYCQQRPDLGRMKVFASQSL